MKITAPYLSHHDNCTFTYSAKSAGRMGSAEWENPGRLEMAQNNDIGGFRGVQLL